MPLRLSCVLFTLLLATHIMIAAPSNNSVNIQGLGQIQLSQSFISNAVAVTGLKCQTFKQAQVLHAKLYDDLTWDKKCGLQLLKTTSALPILGHQHADCLLIGRDEKTVYIINAESPSTLAMANKQLKKQGQTLSFDRIKDYPAMLNFTDLAPLYMNLHHFGRKGDLKGQPLYSAKAIQDPYDYWKAYGTQMGINLRTYMGFDNHFDNKPHTYAIEHEMSHAQKRDMPYYIWIGPHQIPWWLRWKFPDDVAQPDPYAIPTWNPHGFLGGGNLSMSASDEAFAYVHRYNMQMINTLKKNGEGQMSALRLAIGRPGDELGLHLFSTELMDHSPAGQRGLHHWLKTQKNLNLAQLGKRWHGDPKHFDRWEQVRLPSLFSFFGDFGDDSFNLLTNWNWRTYQAKLDNEQWWKPDIKIDSKQWQSVNLAPSTDQLHAFGSELDKTQRQGNSTVACMRKTFVADPWLVKHRNQRVYLVINSYNAKPVQIHFNGMDLGSHKARQRWRGPVGIDVSSLIKTGKNTLALRMPEGRILGPVFLTTHRPGYYPYDDSHKNARWVDMRDYMAHTLMDGYLRMVNPIRKHIADWPILFNVGSSFSTADQYLRVKNQTAIRAIHNTGAEASYRPWWPGLGYVIGTYGSSEESSTASDMKLGRELGWILFNAESTHSYIYDGAIYQQMDEKTGWFTKNKRLWQLMGKYIWNKPQVAIFRSPKGSLYYPYQDEQHSWDLGRGSLQRAHYNNVYVTESELNARLADDYPVIFDCNNQVLTQQAIDDLKVYVQKGGTYIALQNTGRHDPLHKDTWPIQQLTGCKVIGKRSNMMVQITQDNPLLKTLAGQTFKGNGAAINWVGDNYADHAIALEPTAEVAKAFTPIAFWEDGTVAAGVRRLGKGRVIILGSTFWRSSSDRGGKGIYLQGGLEATFLRDLFAGLGLTPQVQTDNSDIWARRMITKNGTQQWMMLFNSNASPLKQVTMQFDWDHDPRQIFDVVTGKNVPYRYQDGKVIVESLDFEKHQVHVLGIWQKNFDQSIAQWYQIKAKFEKAPNLKKQPSVDLKSLPDSSMFVLNQFDFYQLQPSEKLDPAWLIGGKPTKPWKQVGHGFWDQMGHAPTGKAVYHSTVNVPSDWQGRNMIMVMASWDGPVLLGNADIYVNGKLAGNYRQHGWNNNDSYDLTDYLKSGLNHVCFVMQSNEYRGGLMGQIGLYAQKTLRDVIEIKQVQLVKNPNEQKTISMPMQRQKAQYLKFEIDVPAHWDAKQTYLQLVAQNRKIAMVRINGRPINYHQYLHPYPRHMQINLSPWIKPGQRNEIELWPHDTIASHKDKPRSPVVNFDMQLIRLGTLSDLKSNHANKSVSTVRAQISTTPNIKTTINKSSVVANGQAKPDGKNLMTNASFETYGSFEQMQIHDHIKRARDVKQVQIKESHWMKNWQPGCHAYEKEIPKTGSVSIDQSVQYDGKVSVKIHNQSLTDITYVDYKPEHFKGQDKLTIKPNRRYRLTWQVKGQDIQTNNDGPGPIMMMYYVTQKNGKSKRVNMYTRGKTQGDFDWTQKQFDFTTDAHAQTAVFGFQLRRASGTLWYDNIKLLDMGSVTAVESF